MTYGTEKSEAISLRSKQEETSMESLCSLSEAKSDLVLKLDPCLLHTEKKRPGY